MKKEVLDSNYFIHHNITVNQYSNTIIEMEKTVLMDKEVFENMVERVEHLTEGLKDVVGDVGAILNKRMGIRELPKELEMICEKGTSILRDPTITAINLPD